MSKQKQIEVARKKLPDIDFRSGCNFQNLNDLIDQFDELDRHEFDDQMALEVHSMKEHIFHITGCLSKMDKRFPVANEYMLLSGGLKTGSIHIDQRKKSQIEPSEILPSSISKPETNRGDDFDLDYTLLVPVIKVSENEHENSLILDMRKSANCHSWLVARPDIDEKLMMWSDCFVTGPPRTSEPADEKLIEQLVDLNVDKNEDNLTNGSLNGDAPPTNVELCQTPDNEENEPDLSDQLIYLCPLLVSKWFSEHVIQICQNTEILQNMTMEQKGKALLGIPNIVSCKRTPPGVTLILACGGTRIQYDLIPVISFYGWPKVAESILNIPHIWGDTNVKNEVTKGFHLIPAYPMAQDITNDLSFTPSEAHQIMREWRFSFARSEVTIKKAIPMPFMKSFYAFLAVMVKQLTRYRHLINPYALRAIFFFAADRLPISYLERHDKVAVNFLGLIDDILQCLLTQSCPNYFIHSYNIFKDLSQEDINTICKVVLMVRSDPTSFLQEAVNSVRFSRRQSSISRNHRLGKKTDIVSIDYTGQHQLSQERANQTQKFDKKLSEDEDPMVERVKRMIESNPGKSISVFLNPDDVSKAHFRVDDRFF